MLYCTYDQYAAAGGTVPEAVFGVLCSRASRMIDAATFGRAEPHAAGCEACREALADACAQIVGLLAAASAAGAVPGAAKIGADQEKCGDAGWLYRFHTGPVPDRGIADALCETGDHYGFD